MDEIPSILSLFQSKNLSKNWPESLLFAQSRKTSEILNTTRK
jgi:hypothetical protein